MGRARLKDRSGPREIGRFIYAYCHIRTNQVVYSLTQNLKSNAAIKQLPDTGANNTPTHIRKDVWRPLFTLTFPDGSQRSLAQGLDTFRKLREWRKLHELNWEPPLALSQPYSEAQIDSIEQHLLERGGSKKESAHDIIKRQKHKIRERMVMDQKANSIADLAAVLLQQEELGEKRRNEMGTLQHRAREEHIQRMLWLAALGQTGVLERLNASIAAIESQLSSEETMKERKRRRRLKHQLIELLSMRTVIQSATEAVESVQARFAPRAQVQPDKERSAEHELEEAEQEHNLSVSLNEYDDETGLSMIEVLHATGRAQLLERLLARAERTDKVQKVAQEVRAFVPGSPRDSEAYLRSQQVRQYESELVRGVIAAGGNVEAEVDSIRQKLLDYEIELIQDHLSKSDNADTTMLSAEMKVLSQIRDAATRLADQTMPVPDWIQELRSIAISEPENAPKYGAFRRKPQLVDRPVFSTEGVVIKWNNLLDPEYAERWPENVAHEPMGWYRHTAPKADAPLVADMDEYAQANEKAVKSRDKGPSPERKQVIETVKSEILRKVMARETSEKQARLKKSTSEHAAAGDEGAGGEMDMKEGERMSRPQEPALNA